MTPKPPPPDTHYCDWDAPGRLVVRAICTVVMKRTEHSNDPTCANCLAGLALRKQLDADA